MDSDLFPIASFLIRIVLDRRLAILFHLFVDGLNRPPVGSLLTFSFVRLWVVAVLVVEEGRFIESRPVS